MSPEQRKAILDAADAFGTARDHWAEILDALTERGFSISLDSVRDHTQCQTCHNRANGLVCSAPGAPVVWSATDE